MPPMTSRISRPYNIKTRISGPYGPLKILAPAESLLASLTRMFASLTSSSFSPSTSSSQPSPQTENFFGSKQFLAIKKKLDPKDTQQKSTIHPLDILEYPAEPAKHPPDIVLILTP